MKQALLNIPASFLIAFAIACTAATGASSQDYQALMNEAANEMREVTIVQMVVKNGDQVTNEMGRQIENCQLGKKYPILNTQCDALAKTLPAASSRYMLTRGLDAYKEKCLDVYIDFKPEKDKKGVKKKNLEGKLDQLVQKYLEKAGSEQKKEEPKKEEKEGSRPTAWRAKMDQELSGLNTPLKKLNRLSELHSQYQGDNNDEAARYAIGQMVPQLQALAADQAIPLEERKKILQDYTENFRNTNAGKTAETLLKGLNEIKPIGPKPKTPNLSPVSISQLLKPARTLSDSVNMLRNHQGREEVQQLLTRIEQQLRQRCKNAYSKSDNAVTLRLLNLYLAVFPKGTYAAEAKALQGALVPTVVNLKDQEAWVFALAAEGTQRLPAFEAYLNYRDAKGQPGFYHQACQDSIAVFKQRKQLAQDIDAATTIQQLAAFTTEAERIGMPELAFKADDKAWGIATQARTEEAYRRAFDGENGRPRGIHLNDPISTDPTPWWVWGGVGLFLLGVFGWLGRKKIRAFFVKKPDFVPDSPGPAPVIYPPSDPPAKPVIPPPSIPSKEEIKTQKWQEAKQQNTLEAYIGFYRNYPEDRAAREKIDDWIVQHEKDIIALEGGLPLFIGTPWHNMVQQALETLQKPIDLKRQAWEKAMERDQFEDWVAYYLNYPEDHAGQDKIQAHLDTWMQRNDIILLEQAILLLGGSFYEEKIQTFVQDYRENVNYAPAPHPNGYFDRFQLRKEPEGCWFEILLSKDKDSGSFSLISTEAVILSVIQSNFANLERACVFENGHIGPDGRRKTRINISARGRIILSPDRKWLITEKCQIRFLDQ